MLFFRQETEVIPLEKKIRHSHQRELIFSYLCSHTDHPSAEMIYRDLRPQIPGLSLGTVYRNLKLLEELGKIRRVTNLQGTERYDALCEDHAHFLCSCCGALRDLTCTDLNKLRSAITLEEGYTLSNLDVTVTGLCPNCIG